MIILVHGGAARVASTIIEPKLADLRLAAKTGYLQLLKSDHNPKNPFSNQALEAVQSAVVSMENSPYFNAGFGSSLTSIGTVEMDAIIADGLRVDFGAVASVTDYPNPVRIARAVLDHTQHCLFTREGAHRVAEENGLNPIKDQDALVHSMAKDRLAEYRTFKNAIAVDKKLPESGFKESAKDHDTVGSVAMDQAGNFAAATSTGGITGKLPGRVGDTPVIGSGAYADNQLGAVSTTGHGEAIMRVCLARDTLYRHTSTSPRPSMQQSVESALDNMRTKVEGYGGVIALGPQGEVGVAFTTSGMPWAMISSEDNPGISLEEDGLMDDRDGLDKLKLKIHYGYLPGEKFTVIE